MERKCQICNDKPILDNLYYTDKNGNKVDVLMCENCLIEDSKNREGICSRCEQVKDIFYSPMQDKGSNEWICEDCLQHEMKNTMFMFRGPDGKAPAEAFFCKNCGIALKKNFCIRCGKVPDTIWVTGFSEKFAKLKNKFKDVEDIDKKFSLIADNLRTELLSGISNFIVLSDIETHLAYKFKREWEKLMVSSKTFLTTGKFLYVVLNQQTGDFDFSPVVIEFSKALEKELYEKIFKNYKDKTSSKTSTNTALGEFLRGERELTLGQISYILNLAESDPDFTNFLKECFTDYHNYFHIYKFPKKLEKFVYKFRNKSAHVEPISREDCEECESYLLEEPIQLLIRFIRSLQTSKLND